MTPFDLSTLPYPSEQRIAVHVRPAAERALHQGHPWLFEESIQRQNREGNAGDLAVIFDSKNRFLAVGLYDPHSVIRVKVLQHNTRATINAEWFTERLQKAAERREALSQSAHTTGYRLLHGENDGFPGLVVDRYGETLVIKLYSAAWLPHFHAILPALSALQPAERIVLRLSRLLQNDPDTLHGLYDGQLLQGDDEEGLAHFLENGLHFAADVIHGHKTGFFFDHRDNRQRVGQLARGRKVLDVFAYTGGFSLYAAHGGAKEVLSVDISGPALKAAQHNFSLNAENAKVSAAKHEIIADDAFGVMERLINEGRTFDMVILDPPSFAKRADEVERALASYTKLTELAVQLLDSGAILVMASCSSRVSEEDFYETVLSTAQESRKTLWVQQRNGHAIDHPVGFAEGAYLKCLFASTID